MSDQLNQVYTVADGGPFTLAIDNGDRDIIIENVTDDLVNAGILVKVEPTDRWCETHDIFGVGTDESTCSESWYQQGECRIIGLVRVEDV